MPFYTTRASYIDGTVEKYLVEAEDEHYAVEAIDDYVEGIGELGSYSSPKPVTDTRGLEVTATALYAICVRFYDGNEGWYLLEAGSGKAAREQAKELIQDHAEFESIDYTTAVRCITN